MNPLSACKKIRLVASPESLEYKEFEWKKMPMTITVFKEWSFDSAKLPSANRQIYSDTFGNYQTWFSLFASKSYGEPWIAGESISAPRAIPGKVYHKREMITCGLNLASSNPKPVSVKGTFKYKSSTATCSGYEAYIPFTAGK